FFAAWPMVSAASLSGFYVAFLLAPPPLFFPPVAFAHRSQIAHPPCRSLCAWGAFIGSFVPPLVIVVVDAIRAAGPKIFGPAEGAPQLEGPKAFTKDFVARHQIPTAGYQNFTAIAPALAALRAKVPPIVIQADGLTAGPG
ncbi:cytochrome d ubiquinol oxidase subunit II, partial [Salmonella enterica]|uniref:cytochrome d ubiquinol oxidase subunit II n=1 Tax=Salmonella enterica TaxID=28901 RepID=UPI00190D2E21